MKIKSYEDYISVAGCDPCPLPRSQRTLFLMLQQANGRGSHGGFMKRSGDGWTDEQSAEIHFLSLTYKYKDDSTIKPPRNPAGHILESKYNIGFEYYVEGAKGEPPFIVTQTESGGDSYKQPVEIIYGDPYTWESARMDIKAKLDKELDISKNLVQGPYSLDYPLRATIVYDYPPFYYTWSVYELQQMRYLVTLDLNDPYLNNPLFVEWDEYFWPDDPGQPELDPELIAHRVWDYDGKSDPFSAWFVLEPRDMTRAPLGYYAIKNVTYTPYKSRMGCPPVCELPYPDKSSDENSNQ